MTDPAATSFFAQVRKRMDELHLDQSELARRATKSRQWASKVLHETINPTLALMRTVARALNADIDIILKPKRKDDR